MPDDDDTLRFLADMGVSWRVVEWLRSQGYDAKHLREEGLERLFDPDILASKDRTSSLEKLFKRDVARNSPASGQRRASRPYSLLKLTAGRPLSGWRTQVVDFIGSDLDLDLGRSVLQCA